MSNETQWSHTKETLDLRALALSLAVESTDNWQPSETSKIILRAKQFHAFLIEGSTDERTHGGCGTSLCDECLAEGSDDEQ